MKFNIYDYANRPVEIETQNKPIKEIFVRIFSGDEVIVVTYVDNDEDEFDSSNERIESYLDGFYTVTKQRLKKWMNWKPHRDAKYYSYCRQRQFGRRPLQEE